MRWGSFIARRTVYLLFAALLLTSGGCAYYSFTGASAGHLRSIAIPAFDNRTAEFGVAENLTESLINLFTTDGTLKVRDVRTADAVLYGTVTSINERPSAITSSETVSQYQVTIVVRLRFEDRVQGKVAWEESVTQSALYDFSSGSTAERDAGLEEAVGKLADDILSKTVSGW